MAEPVFERSNWRAILSYFNKSVRMLFFYVKVTPG